MTRQEQFLHNLRALLVTAVSNAELPDMNGAQMEYVVGMAECLLKADAEEPVFVLRAQDKTAAATVDRWIQLNDGQISDDKYEAAYADMMAMARWPHKKQAD
jgi:hypothetical protein